MIAKSIAIKARGGKSGGSAVKAVDPTPGDLRGVRKPGLNGPARAVIAARKPAEGIVVGFPTKARTMDRAIRTVRSCGPGGRRSSWNWPWGRRRRVSPAHRGPRDRSPHGACRPRECPATGPGPSIEAVIQPGNLKKALARVRRNRGAPGVDGPTVDDLGDHLQDRWPEIRCRLLAGTCAPQPVRRVEIPKASGVTRPLGVPTVLDRFI